MDSIWFVGDNFASTTYRKHFLLREDNEENSFIKTNYEYKMVCNSRFNSPTENMLIRLQNTFAAALNKKEMRMPKYIIVVLDDDLISFLRYSRKGLADIMERWVTWLVHNFEQLLVTKRNKLPKKAVRMGEPCVYWCAAPVHNNFDDSQNIARKVFNSCLDSLLKGNQTMRVIKFKDHWNVHTEQLIRRGNYTDYGYSSFWDAVDAAFKFNVSRHEFFVAKRLVMKNQEDKKPKVSNVNNEVHKEEYLHADIKSTKYPTSSISTETNIIGKIKILSEKTRRINRGSCFLD